MSRPKTQPIPPFLAQAETFYGEAFDHTSKKALARSMTEWAELDEDEQSFSQAHLLFLNLQAQAATQRLLLQVRDLLDEVAEGLTTAIEASLAEPADEAEDEVPTEGTADPGQVAFSEGAGAPQEAEIDGPDGAGGAE